MATPVPPGGGGGSPGGGLVPPTTTTTPTQACRTHGTCRTSRSTRSPGTFTCWSCLIGTNGSCYASCSGWTTSPGLRRSSTTQTQVKIPPTIFKGLPGERPEAHLLRANDWMDTYNVPPVNKPANFKHTLDHLAREWYDSLIFPIAWNDLQQRFS